MKSITEKRRRLPRESALQGRNLILRRLGPEDREAMITFAAELPPDDLLFLRRDITQAAEMDKWLRGIDEGNLITVVALEEQRLVGYATFDRGTVNWTRHVAEIRVTVAKEARGIGVGRLLLELAFETALEEGVSKIVARMTPDQARAMALFQRLGFRQEAVLRKHARDMNGQDRDLLLFSFHTGMDQDQRCEGCGSPVLAALSLGSLRLCSVCYDSQYEELGAGD